MAVTSASQRIVELPVPVLAALGAGLVAAAVAGAAFGERGPTPGPIAMTATLAVSFGPLAVFVLRRLPGDRVGRLMLLTGAAATVNVLAVCWSAAVPLAWLSQWSWWPPLATIPLILLLVPDGRPPSPGWRFVVYTLAGAAAFTTAVLAVAAVAEPRMLLSTIDPLPPAVEVLTRVAFAGVAVVVVGTAAVLVALFVRWGRAEALERRQLACLLPSAVLFAVGVVLDSEAGVPWGWVPGVVALPLGLTVAVLQYRLHNLDLYIHRGTVWLVLSGLAVAVYAASATALGETIAGASHTTMLLAVGAAAAILHPAERFVRRAISRLLYGRRDDPYAILTRQGRLLENATDPMAVLPGFAAALVDGLKVPYTAIVLREPDGSSSVAAEHGRLAGEPERFAMTVHGNEVGDLIVSPRRPGEQFSTAEVRLLQDLAVQAGQAAVAYRSTLTLQRARERLVLAREEERRKLRRDLHDGVAASLVGARMIAEAASGKAADDAPTRELLDVLAAELDTCTAEVRSLIDGLRPAALDDGLERAVRELTERLPEPRLDVHVDGDLVDLPAAIEVATYRIVSEAVANVAKHAGAKHCSVTLTRDATRLEVTVLDDGDGFADPSWFAGTGTSGVGLSSIRSRVEELGGMCDIGSTADGTRLHVALPVRG
jgi:signal transduction histidine kinase